MSKRVSESLGGCRYPGAENLFQSPGQPNENDLKICHVVLTETASTNVLLIMYKVINGLAPPAGKK